MKRFTSEKAKHFLFFLCILLFLAFSFSLSFTGQKASPTISVSLRLTQQDGDCISLTWHVTNDSDFPISFKENQIAQIQVNGHPYPHPIGAVTLNPGEELVYPVTLKDIDTSQHNTLQFTAQTQSTKASFRMTLPKQECDAA